MRVNWTFTPQLSFQLYAQPLISAGHYHGYKELAQPASYSFTMYGEGASTITSIPASDGSIEAFSVDPDGPGPAPADGAYHGKGNGFLFVDTHAEVLSRGQAYTGDPAIYWNWGL